MTYSIIEIWSCGGNMYTTYNIFKSATRQEYINKDNQELVAAYKGSNATEQSQIFGALFVKNIALAHKCLQKMKIEQDEKAHIVCQEILTALNTYNPEICKFTTYLSRLLTNRVLWNFVSKVKKDERMPQISMNMEIGEDGTLMDVLSDKETSYDLDSNYEKMKENINKMFDFEIGNMQDKVSMQAITKDGREFVYNKQQLKFAKEMFNKYILDIEKGYIMSQNQIGRQMGFRDSDTNITRKGYVFHERFNEDGNYYIEREMITQNLCVGEQKVSRAFNLIRFLMKEHELNLI